MTQASLSALIRNGIRRAEMRHKMRLRSIALGARGRHPGLVQLCEEFCACASELCEVEYLLFFPRIAKSATEVVTVLARRDSELEFIVPHSEKQIERRIRNLSRCFLPQDNDVCKACDSGNGNCQIFLKEFVLHQMPYDKAVRAIGELISEAIELETMPSNFVLGKNMQIPVHRILVSEPNCSGYNGVLVVVTQTLLDSDKARELCENLQVVYLDLLRSMERNIIMSEQSEAHIEKKMNLKRITERKSHMRKKVAKPQEANGPRRNVRGHTTIIGTVEGDLVQQQYQAEGINMEGDSFSNISNSIIATRGSIAKGIIKVQELGNNEIADALRILDEAIGQARPEELPPEKQDDTLALLNELTRLASDSRQAKSVLRSIGESLYQAIKEVGSIWSAVVSVWPTIESLWS